MLPSTLSPRLLSQLESLRIRSRRAFLGSRQGGHVSPKRGHGIEFSDYRKYELGDNPRHIDWSVYARSDRLYIKRFQEEQDRSLVIIIDSSASMTEVGGEKWTRARDLALSLSYVALMEQDTVVVATTGAGASPRFHGGRAIHQIAQHLAAPPPSARALTADQVRRVLASVRFPGVAVMISDFLFEREVLEGVVRVLLAKNFDTTLVQLLSAGDVDPFATRGPLLAIDSESGDEVELAGDDAARTQYAFLLDQHTRDLQRIGTHHHMRFTRFLPSLSLDEFMLQHLPASGLLSA